MKHKRAQLFYDQIEQILNLYGDDDIKRKIEYVKNFIKEEFGVDEFDDSYIEIERLHSKRLMWLFVSLIIDFEASQKMNIPEKTGKQEKFKSLEVEDIFLIEELTTENVEFIEKFLEKTNVDLETEANSNFVISTNQMIYLLRKIMQEYRAFLSNAEKF